MRAIEIVTAALLVGATGCSANVEDDGGASATGQAGGGGATTARACDATRILLGDPSCGRREPLNVGPQLVSGDPFNVCVTLDLEAPWTTMVVIAEPMEPSTNPYDLTLWTRDGDLLQRGWNEQAWGGGTVGILSWTPNPDVHQVVVRVTSRRPASTVVSFAFPVPT